MVGEGVDTPEKLAMLTGGGLRPLSGLSDQQAVPLNELAIWALSGSRSPQTSRLTTTPGRWLQAGADVTPDRSTLAGTRKFAARAAFP